MWPKLICWSVITHYMLWGYFGQLGKKSTNKPFTNDLLTDFRRRCFPHICLTISSKVTKMTMLLNYHSLHVMESFWKTNIKQKRYKMSVNCFRGHLSETVVIEGKFHQLQTNLYVFQSPSY